MAKSQQQLEREYRATKCGQFLVEFINTADPEAAAKNLINGARKSFKFQIQNPTAQQLGKIHDEIPSEQGAVEELVYLLDQEDNLYDIERIHGYVATYNYRCLPLADITEDGTITESAIFDSPEGAHLHDVVCYCIVTFLQIERNSRLIRQCQEDQKCGRYFLAKSDRGKDKLRFCSNSCRSRYARYQKTGVYQAYEEELRRKNRLKREKGRIKST